MVSMSTAFNDRAFDSVRKVQCKIAVGGYSANITEDNIISMEVTEALADGNVTIGSAQSASLVLKLKDAAYTFQGKTLQPYIGFNNEWCKLGTFYVTDVVNNDGEVTVTAYDHMAMLEAPFIFSGSSASCMPANVMYQISTAADIDIITPSGGYPFMEIWVPEGATMRQMIGYIAGLMGTNARFNRDDRLEFVWYDQHKDIYGDVNGDHQVTATDVTYIDNNLIGTASDVEHASILGSTIVGTAYLGADIVDLRRSRLADVNENGVVDTSDRWEVNEYVQGRVHAGTLVGTLAGYAQELEPNLYYMGELTTGETIVFNKLIAKTEEDTPIESGTGRAITFENPFMTQNQLNTIKAARCPFTVDAGSITYVGNPAWEIGDIIHITDVKNNTLDMPIMSQKLSYDGGMSIKIDSYGLTEEKESVMPPDQSISHADIDRKVNASKTEVEGEIETQVASAEARMQTITNQITETLNNAQGVYGGTYELLYGSDIDPAALDEKPIGFRIKNNTSPNKWWQFTYGGLAFTDDRGASYTVGITNDGRILANDIVAGTVLSNEITATDLNITGGTVNLQSADDDSLIELRKNANNLMTFHPTYIAGVSSGLSGDKYVIEIGHGAIDIEHFDSSQQPTGSVHIGHNGIQISGQDVATLNHVPSLTVTEYVTSTLTIAAGNSVHGTIDVTTDCIGIVGQRPTDTGMVVSTAFIANNKIDYVIRNVKQNTVATGTFSFYVLRKTTGGI